MRTLKTLFALTLGLAALPAIAEFEVTALEQTETKARVTFITQERYDSICRLSVEKITISSPKTALANGLVDRAMGAIEVQADINEDSRCFIASGSHSGVVELDKGEGLPRLEKGKTYRLIVNGHETTDIVVR